MIKKEDILKETANKIIEEVIIRNHVRSKRNQAEVFEKITCTISHSERLRKNRFLKITAACSVAAVICVAVLCSINNISSTIEAPQINYQEIAKQLNPQSKEVILSVNNSSSIEVKNNSNIEHTAEGEIKVNDQVVENIEESHSKISQVVVPKSKRAEVMLSDGTKVTLNSDSRIIYATNFDSKTREVYIEGEAFLDVAKDTTRPFTVKTKKFTVNVTGTKFNITSYDDNQISSVVLVEGKVNIDVENKAKMHLDPGQMMQIDNHHSKIENVDTYKYTCWMDKIMIFENQSLNEVANRVSRFYDVDIVIQSSHSNMIINGKLDLKDDVKDVIKTLSTISNLKTTQISNSTILTD